MLWLVWLPWLLFLCLLALLLIDQLSKLLHQLLVLLLVLLDAVLHLVALLFMLELKLPDFVDLGFDLLLFIFDFLLLFLQAIIIILQALELLIDSLIVLTDYLVLLNQILCFLGECLLIFVKLVQRLLSLRLFLLGFIDLIIVLLMRLSAAFKGSCEFGDLFLQLLDPIGVSLDALFKLFVLWPSRLQDHVLYLAQLLLEL